MDGNREPIVFIGNEQCKELELKATTNALLSVAAAFSAITIAIYLDNRTAIAYLNRCGDTSSRALGDVALAVTSWREERRVSLVAYYVPDLWPVDTDVFRSKLERTATGFFATWTLQPGATIVRPFHSVGRQL